MGRGARYKQTRLPDVLLQRHNNFRDLFVSFCPYCIVAPNLQLADRQSYLATLTPHTQDLAIYFTTDLAACSLFMDFESRPALLGNHFRSKFLADLLTCFKIKSSVEMLPGENTGMMNCCCFTESLLEGKITVSRLQLNWMTHEVWICDKPRSAMKCW